MKNIIFIILFAINIPEVLAGQCKVNELIEKERDFALSKIQKMTSEELRCRELSGGTAFFWAIFNGSNKVRDFLLKKVPSEELLSEEKTVLIHSICASESQCPVENIPLLHSKGFEIDTQAISNAVTGTQECSLEKFQVLKKLGAPLTFEKNSQQNLLHIIISRARSGRPLFDINCLVSAVKILAKENPEFLKQKNSNKHTPKEMIKYLLDHTQEWGPGVTQKYLEQILKAL